MRRVWPGILAVTLQSAGIPCYQARKDSAARHGLSRMLVGALRCISGGFLRADVLQVAKSGFSSLTRDEADSLENYAITHGINRGKWLRPFPYGDDAADMDELRVRLISPVEALRDVLRRAKTAGDSVEAIFRFLEDTNAYGPPDGRARKRCFRAGWRRKQRRIGRYGQS